MTSDHDELAANAGQDFLKQLTDTGFFDQISNLETSLKSIVVEIDSFSATNNQRQEESENIAAHILAIESVLTTLMKKYPLEETDLVEEVRRQADPLSAGSAPNPTVEAIAVDLLRKSQN